MSDTLAFACHHQEEIKKSRFAAWATPVASVDQAMAFFSTHADPDATHNCWAYRIGAQYRTNDDGEPGGTAGRPILQAIEGQLLDRVAVLVVRWYGGIKLGAGGLVRAYGGVAAQCLRAGERVEIVEMAQVSCSCGYAELAMLRSRAAAAGAAIVNEDFGAHGVQLKLEVPCRALEDLERTVANITRGQSSWSVRR